MLLKSRLLVALLGFGAFTISCKPDATAPTDQAQPTLSSQEKNLLWKCIQEEVLGSLKTGPQSATETNQIVHKDFSDCISPTQAMKAQILTVPALEPFKAFLVEVLSSSMTAHEKYIAILRNQILQDNLRAVYGNSNPALTAVLDFALQENPSSAACTSTGVASSLCTVLAALENNQPISDELLDALLTELPPPTEDIAVCGDGKIVGTEECDGTTVGCDNTTCTALSGYTCSNNVCDNVNECDTATACDGHGTCTDTVGSYTCACTDGYSGTICTTAPVCGDSVLTSNEQCDGSLLNNKTCASLFYNGGGTLACNPNCTFDTSNCWGFEGARAFDSGFNTYTVSSGDLNEDGNLDMVAASDGSSNKLNILFGNGDGTYQAITEVSMSGAFFTAIADFDGDNHLDIAITGDGKVRILTGNEMGNFATAPMTTVTIASSRMVVADLDNDSDLDIAVSAGTDLNVLLNQGSMNFTPTTYSNSSVGDARHLATGDFNSDGFLDIAVAYSGVNDNFANGNVSIFMNNQSGAFTDGDVISMGNAAEDPYESPFGVATGDFNGDGQVDLAVSTYGHSDDSSGTRIATFERVGVIVLAGGNDGTFNTTTPIFQRDYSNQNTAFRSITAADLNGDGRLDLFTNSGPSGAQVLFGNTSNSFDTPVSVESSFGAEVISGDVNEDGNLDLVLADNHGATASDPNSFLNVVLNKGAGNFMVPKRYDIPLPDGVTGRNKSFIAIDDFNQDGRLDLVLKGGTLYAGSPVISNGLVYVFLQELDGSFTRQGTSYDMEVETPESIQWGQFAGDSSLDIAVLKAGTYTILQGQGNFIFVLPTSTTSTLNNPQSVNLSGDFNRDGETDSLVLETGYSNSAHLELGGAAPQSVYYGSSADDTSAVADLNGDGKDDLIMIDYQSISILYGR